DGPQQLGLHQFVKHNLLWIIQCHESLALFRVHTFKELIAFIAFERCRKRPLILRILRISLIRWSGGRLRICSHLRSAYSRSSRRRARSSSASSAFPGARGGSAAPCLRSCFSS